MNNAFAELVASNVGNLVRDEMPGVADDRGDYLTDVVRVSSFGDTGLLTNDSGFVITLANGAEFQVEVKLSKQPDTGWQCFECGAWFPDDDPGGRDAHLVVAHDYVAVDAREVAES